MLKNFFFIFAPKHRKMIGIDTFSEARHSVQGLELPDANKDNILEAIDYGEECYVDHCEEIGRFAVVEIDEIKSETVALCGDILLKVLETHCPEHVEAVMKEWLEQVSSIR